MSISFLAGIQCASLQRRKTFTFPEISDYPRRKEMTNADWLEVWKEILSSEDYEKRRIAILNKAAQGIKEKNT